jgi:Synergist-CTERM protein sorting domain-containing protein
MLFDVIEVKGADGFGTDIVKEVIKSKTAEEFASPEMAALLNNGRTGADAPWEYIEGNPYPTLKDPDSGTDSYTGPGVGGGGGCDTGAAGMAVLAALGVAMVARRRSR